MITCHIASISDREESLMRVIRAIMPQVDRIYVALNGYKEIPPLLRNSLKVKPELLDNSLGDAAKLLHVNDDNSIVFTLDDDLIVPPQYVSYMIRGLRLYKGVVSWHGKCYANRPIKSFRRNFTSNYRCLNSVEHDSKCDVIGTGCMAYDSLTVKVDNTVFEQRNMADVLFSRFCTYNNIPMTVLAHKNGWLQYIPQTSTIWRNSTDDTVQTRIINEFLK